MKCVFFQYRYNNRTERTRSYPQACLRSSRGCLGNRPYLSDSRELDIWYQLLRVTPESQRPSKPCSHVQVSEKTSENKTLKGILGLFRDVVSVNISMNSVFLVVLHTTLYFEPNANESLCMQAGYFQNLLCTADSAAAMLVTACFLYWGQSSAVSGISKCVILHLIH